MKKIMIMLLVGMVSLQAFGKKVQRMAAPECVINSFKMRYPNVKKVVWETVDSLNYYASFNYNNGFQIVKFDKDGNWKETIEEMDNIEFTDAVTKTIDETYHSFYVFDAKMITTPNHVFYQIHLNNTVEGKIIQVLSDGNLLVEMEYAASFGGRRLLAND